jgi:hypothetical protein
MRADILKSASTSGPSVTIHRAFGKQQPLEVKLPSAPSEIGRSHETNCRDKVLRGMANAGLGGISIAELLGLTIEEVSERASALGAPKPHDRPARKLGPRGWSTGEVRLFIAVWIDNVATKSIATTIGRSAGAIYAKRRRLGLESRQRSETRERSIEACVATPLPWETAAVASAPERSEKTPRMKWTEATEVRCAMLALAGLNNKAVAKQLTIELGSEVTEHAVKSKVNRLQIVRDRKDMMTEYVEELIEPRANARMKALRMQLRKCDGLNRLFFYSPVLGGTRTTCREFSQGARFSGRRQERECAAHILMA